MKITSYIILIFMLAGCADVQKKNEHDHNVAEKKLIQYTCSMHPQIIRDQPGTCPICGMELVPVNKTNTPEIVLTDSQMKLANITTEQVSNQEIAQTITVNGRLVANEEKITVISSRASGRIEKLFFKETGRVVKKGEPLYEIYSETLLTLQQEYLLALEQAKVLNRDDSKYLTFVNTAEKKLLLYGISKDQIKQLANAKVLLNHITLLSPTEGIISEINVAEGQYVSEGSMMYKIANNNTLWVEAELYPQETSLAKLGDEVEVSVSGFDSEPTKAIISFLTPQYKANTQILIMRATLANKDMIYKPGMQAKVKFKLSSKQALIVPASAVIHNGKGAHVYVETKTNTFQARLVKTGIENPDQVEIIEGLEEGEILAISGAYLLYSDMVLKGLEPTVHHH